MERSYETRARLFARFARVPASDPDRQGRVAPRCVSLLMPRDPCPAAPAFHRASLRIIHRRSALKPAHAIASAQSTTSPDRSASADPNDSPTPVSISTYAAMHPGHLGISTNPAMGRPQRASVPPRPAQVRAALGAFDAFPFWQHRIRPPSRGNPRVPPRFREIVNGLSRPWPSPASSRPASPATGARTSSRRSDRGGGASPFPRPSPRRAPWA